MNRTVTNTDVDRADRTGADEAFIAGGGETGEVIRSIDWRGSLLGPPGEWPQSLRTSLSI